MWCQPGCESCWHLCLLGSVTAACQVGAEGRKWSVMELYPRHFVTVPIEKVCSCRVVWASTAGLGQCSAPVSALQDLHFTESSRQTSECCFWAWKSPFPSLLSFRFRERALPSHLPLQFLSCFSNWELCSSLISLGQSMPSCRKYSLWFLLVNLGITEPPVSQPCWPGLWFHG